MRPFLGHVGSQGPLVRQPWPVRREAVVAAPTAVAKVVVRPCCWPMWGDKGRPTHRYCGADAVAGKPYCVAHGALAWVRLEPRSPAQLAADDSRRAKQMEVGRRRAAGLSWGGASGRPMAEALSAERWG